MTKFAKIEENGFMEDLALDHFDRESGDSKLMWPDWRFAEAVRIPIEKRRGNGCSIWFSKEIKRSHVINQEELRLQFKNVRYDFIQQNKPLRKCLINRLMNRVWAFWWRITQRRVDNIRWSAD